MYSILYNINWVSVLYIHHTYLPSLFLKVLYTILGKQFLKQMPIGDQRFLMAKVLTRKSEEGASYLGGGKTTNGINRLCCVVTVSQSIAHSVKYLCEYYLPPFVQ